MIKLLCFPHAGASSAMYKMWQMSSLRSLSVCPIELPGRGLRYSQTPLGNIPELANFVVSEHWSDFLSPFALFGHSFGALLAFAVAQLLAIRNIYPVHLFVSASRGPHKRPQNMLHSMRRTELLECLVRLNGIPAEMLCDEDLVDFVLPRLQMDLQAAETYCVKAEPLAVPITVFGGTEDSFVGESELEAWGACTSEEFSVRMFSGHHFFLQTRSEDLLASIGTILSMPRIQKLV